MQDSDRIEELSAPKLDDSIAGPAEKKVLKSHAVVGCEKTEDARDEERDPRDFKKKQV